MLDFLNLFWTTDGYRCLSVKTSVMQHFYFESNEEAEAFIETHRDNPGELYFSPTIYTKPERRQENAKTIQAFWLDIDCGSRKSYETQQDGIDAVGDFVKRTGLPSPYIVSSGNGLHVYWALKTPLAPNVWRGMAERLKSLCVFEGLKADPARTSDSASLLRPVGTYNNKSDPPTQVYFILKSQPNDVEELSVLYKLDNDERNEIISTGIKEVSYPDANLAPILEKCAVMADAAKKRGKVEEPVWRGMLSIVYRCTNGVKNIHVLSKGDERYSYDETQQKAEKTGGPYTCNQFASLRPEVCSKCPLYGKITSPILLGLPKKVAIPPNTSVSSPIAQKSERLIKTENFEVLEGGVLKHVDESKAFYITHTPVWVKGVREKVCKPNESGNSTIQLDWLDLGKKYHCVNISQSEVYDRRGFTRWLADNNLRALVKNVEALQEYIMECTREIMRMGTVERYYETLGWSDDGFIIGSRCITKAGPVPASVICSSSVSSLSKKGSKEAWIEATNVFSDKRYWPHAFALLCSFASPLIALCNFQSAVISMVGQSGFGKTLAASFALSVYGEPSLMTQAATTTTNAIGVQMVAQKNVPYLLDEVSAMPMYKLADFIYEATNGRAKETLSQIRTLQQNDGWCLVPFVTSNKSIIEMPDSYIQDAHRRRLIEIPFTFPIEQVSASILAEGFQENYGTVADDYLLYIVNNQDAIKEKVNDVMNSRIMVNIPAVNRFGKWTLACAAVGGEIAQKLNLIRFNPLPIINEAVTILDTDARSVKNEVDIAKSALCAYLYQNNGNINVWSSTSGSVEQSLIRSVVARYNPARDCFYMQRETFSAVLREAGVSIRNVDTWMKASGIKQVTERLGASLPYVLCYQFSRDTIGAPEPNSSVQE